MPRANRYILPGYIYHLTHRCHNRSFLFRFVRDRNEYRKRLRVALKTFNLSLLAYCITSNHTHLLIKAEDSESISNFMQKLEGEFAEYYNFRKRRSGAFWGGRYNCAMIDSGRYLWNCMKYIDLNMVRARVVENPSDWEWCGYNEIIGKRKRYCLLEIPEILLQSQCSSLKELRATYIDIIDEALARRDFSRDPVWTESIAVGSQSFVKQIEEKTKNRIKLSIEDTGSSRWVIRESDVSYS